MPFVTSGSASLHYQRIGSGPPLLLLAGMASDGASWQPVIPPLSRQHELFVLDNRASGQTRDNGEPLTRAMMVADAIALLDTLELDQVSILGHSMGAMLGWALALQAPDRVTTLIPMAALPVATAARVDLFNTLARIRQTGDEADWFRLLFQFLFRPALFNDSSTIDMAVAAAMAYPHKQSTDAFSRQTQVLQSFAEPLPSGEIQCPVHPLCGADDVLSPPSAHAGFDPGHYGISLAKGASVAPTQVIADAAHALHWDQPDAVVSQVLRSTALRR